MTTTVKHFQGAHIKQVDAARRRIQFIASQEAVDADGDVVLQDGLDCRRYQLNPVLLGNHDRTFPCGKVITLRIEARSGGKATIAEAELLPPGASARVDELWAAIQFGAVKGASIAFRPLEADPKPVLSGQTGLTIKAAELYEISVVTVPACPTCLIEQKAHSPRQTVGMVCSPSPRLSITGDRAIPHHRLRADDIVCRLIDDEPTTYSVDPVMVRATVQEVMVRAVRAAAEVAVQRALEAVVRGRVQ